MRNKGFTMVELLVVLGVLAILAALAIPALMSVKRSSQLRTGVQTAAQALKEARTRAITESAPVQVKATDQGVSLAWKTSYAQQPLTPGAVWNQQNAVWEVLEVRSFRLPEGITLWSSSPVFQLDPDGTTKEAVQLEVASEADRDLKPVTLWLSAMGRVSL